MKINFSQKHEIAELEQLAEDRANTNWHSKAPIVQRIMKCTAPCKL